MTSLLQPVNKRIPPGGQPIDLFLKAAIALAQAIQREHQAGHCLLELDPGRILSDATFDVIQRIPPTGQEASGTSPYLAPEQTGRTGQVSAEPADLYVLGLIYFELLTGAAPFPRSDYRQMIHWHLAIPAPLPSQIRPEIPTMLDQLVDRLLQKNPSQRFASARIVLENLILCQKGLAFQGGCWDIARFELNHLDPEPVSLQPAVIVGRDNELEKLKQAFTQASQDRTARVVLVSGPAGIGKSALVQHLTSHLNGLASTCLQGKFDQNRNHAPFSALSEVIQGFLTQLLHQDRTTIESFRQGLERNAADSFPVLLELVPQMARILPEVQSKPGWMASERHYHLQVALKILLQQATVEKPALIILEDIQWADSGSLHLIHQILQQPQDLPMLLILTGRNDELPDSHPVATWLKSGLVQELSLRTLTAPEIRQWLNSILPDTGRAGLTLSDICADKSHGNPLYVNLFLQDLLEQKIISRPADTRKWRIQLDNLLDTGAPDDVLHLIKNRMNHLSEDTIELLEWASCLNHTFDQLLLAGCTGRALADIEDELAAAVQNHLIEPANDGGYRFIHDRIQQVLIAQIAPDRATKIHLCIGAFLATQLGWPSGRKETDDAFLLEIADHFLAGQVQPDILGGWTTLDLVLLFQAAGQKSQAMLAEDRALVYFQQALQQGERINQLDHAEGLYWDLVVSGAEAAFRSGQVAPMKELVSRGLRLAKNLLEQARILEIQIEYLTTHKNYREAFDLARPLLEQLGIHFPAAPSHWQILRLYALVSKSLGQQPEKTITRLQPMTDPRVLVIVRLLATVGIAAYSYSGRTFMYLILLIMRYSLRFGIAPETPVSLAAYGQFLCIYRNNRRLGYAFGQLAVELQRSMASRTHACKTYMVNEIIIRYHREPLAATLAHFPEIHEVGLATGDLSSAGHAMMQHFVYLFLAGQPLKKIAGIMDQYRPVLLQTRDQKSILVSLAFRQVIRNVLAQLPEPWLLGGPDYDEGQTTRPPDIVEDDYPVLFNAALAKLIMALCHGRSDLALAYFQQTSQMEAGAIGTFVVPASWFYGALAHLDTARSCPDRTSRHRHLKQAIRLKRRLDRLETDCPANFSNKTALIQAELDQIKGKQDKSTFWYDQSITQAEQQGFSPELVLACERAALALIAAGRQRDALPYLAQATRVCLAWGDSPWAERLWLRHQALAGDPIPSGSTQPAGQPWADTQALERPTQAMRPGMMDAQIDLDTLIHASQAIAEEIKLDELLRKMIDLVLVHAGANLAVFVTESEQGLRIEAAGTAHGRRPVLKTGQLVKDCPELLEKLVNYVLNTRETRVVQTERAILDFLPGPEAQAAAGKSMICLPIESRQSFSGLLYLENNLMNQAFTERQLNILKVIAAQLAISIENARLYQRMEQMVEQRTLQLVATNNELAIANSQLAEASQAKDQFLAHMSHEIRTPLQGIIGMANVLKRTLTQAEDLAALSAMHSSAQALLTILNEILDLSKLTANKMTFDEQVFSLRELLSDLIPGFSLEATTRHLSLRSHIAPDSLDVLTGDPLRLRQILSNLLSNAIKFTEKGSVEVWARAVPASQEGFAELTVVVKDTGIGIPLELQATIFDRFVQGDSGPARKYAGTGLGLAITKKIVDQMQGTITVASQPGQGSQVTCQLQLKHNPGDGLPRQSTLPREQQLADFRPVLAGLTILLGEDNPVNSLYFKAMLLYLQCKVTVAHDGPAVLAALSGIRYDCLLLDKNMPGLDGLSVIRYIREQEQGTGEHLPVIALTASALAGEQEALLAAGMDACLSKPVDEIQLAEHLLAVRQGQLVQASPSALKQQTPENVEPAFSGDLIDQAQLQVDIELFGQSVFGEIFADLKISLPRRITHMDTLLQRRSVLSSQAAVLKECADVLHQLAGSVAILHADALTWHLKQLEQAARSADIESLENAWPATRDQLVALQAMIA